LREIVDRYAAGLAAADGARLPINSNRRTGAEYLPGTKTLTEVQAVDQVVAHWKRASPEQFVRPNGHATGVGYPSLPRAKCDHVFTADGGQTPEWAVEVKHLSLVGDNGKDNGHTATKAISPLLKDRSLIHDAARLREHPLARRLAVVVYSFNHTEQSLGEARRRHPAHLERIDEIDRLRIVNDGDLSVEPLVLIADMMLRGRYWLKGDMQRGNFTAWRHPCGGHGVVFAWELVNPVTTPLSQKNPW